MAILESNSIRSSSSSFNSPVQFLTSGGTENGTLCRAWVSFNGQGTVAIRADFNVNTIDDDGTGLYTVNFSNALSDGNYSVLGIYEGGTAPGNLFIYASGGTGASPTLMTSSQCRVKSENGQDATTVCVTFFR